ncbi:hypothetical protein, partial [Pseudomonas syringae group genomosp. 7]|uniref:hypothetical protein n=1 Tax=Pseudomonas syringae group genomosp. 7 TaxID=251699 RepID=UPI0037703750
MRLQEDRQQVRLLIGRRHRIDCRFSARSRFIKTRQHRRPALELHHAAGELLELYSPNLIR